MKQSWKLTPQIKSRILELTRQGYGTPRIASIIREESGVELTPQAIWQYRSRNHVEFEQLIRDDLAAAKATSHIGTLEYRLFTLDKIVRDSLEHADSEVEKNAGTSHCAKYFSIAIAAIKTAAEDVHAMERLMVSLQLQAYKYHVKDDRKELEEAIETVTLRLQAAARRKPVMELDEYIKLSGWNLVDENAEE